MSDVVSLAAKIRAAQDVVSEPVYIPLWDVTVNVKGMDGNGRAAYLQRIIAAREDEDEHSLTEIEMEVLIQCVIDPETGLPAFSESDVSWLMDKNGGIIGMLSSKALKASGLDRDAETRLGKPSSESAPATPSAASISISRAS